MAGLPKAGVQLVAEDASAFKAALDSADKSVADFGKSTETIAQSSDKAGKGISAFGQVAIGALRAVGAAAVNLAMEGGKALAGFLKDSVSAAGDFEAGMNDFRVAAGATVDAQGIKDFQKLFLDLGKELPVSTADVQEAATTLVKGGLDPLILKMGGLKSSIQFATAAGLDLNTAAEISVKQMGVWTAASATAAEKTAFLAMSQDLLVKAAGASTLDVDSLAAAMNLAGGQAQALNLDYKDFVTGLTLISPAFGSAEQAGTSYKNFLARLQPSTKPAIAAMTELGLYTKETGSAFFDATGKFVGNAAAAQLLQDATKNLTDADKARLLQTIYGNDAMGAAVALAKSGAEGYNILAKQIGDASGVSEAAALKQQGYNTALENAKGSMEALQITVGMALLPVLSDLLNNYLSPLINAFTALSEGDTFTFFTTLGGLIGDINPALGAFVVSLGLASDPLETLKQAVIDNIPGLRSLIDFGNTPFGQALQRGAAVVGEYFSGQFVTDVTAGAGIVLGKLQELAASPFGQSVIEAATKAGAYIANDFPADFQNGVAIVLGKLKELGDSPFGQNVQAAAKATADYFSGPFQTELSNGIGIVQGKLDALGKSEFGQTMNRGGKVVADYFSGPWQTEVTRGIAVVNEALHIIGNSEWYHDLMRGAATAGDYLSGQWMAYIKQSTGDGKTNLELLGTYMTTDFPGEFQRGADKIGEIFKGVDWGAIGKAVLDGIIQGIKSGTVGLVLAAKEAAQSLLDAAKSVLQSHSPSQAARDQIGLSFSQGAALGVTDGIGLMVGAASDVTNALLNQLGEGGKQVKDLLTGSLKDAGWSASEALQGSLQKGGEDVKAQLMAQLKQTGDAAKPPSIGAGQDVAGGIKEGINNGVPWIIDAAKSAAQAALDAAKAALGIASPSRKSAEELGKPFDEGAAQGIIDNIPILTAATGTLGQAAYDTMGQIGADVQYLWAEAMKVAGQDGEQAFLDKIKSMGEEAKKVLAAAIKDTLDLSAAVPRAIADTRDFLRSIFDPGHFAEEFAKPGGTLLQKLAQETTSAFNEALSQQNQLAGLDPKAAKDFYDFRIKQIEEIAKLEQQEIAAKDAQERGAIHDRLQLVLQAQEAARAQFLNGLQGTAGAGAYAALTSILGGVNDTPLSNIGTSAAPTAFATPAATPSQIYGAGQTGGNTSSSTTNYNYSPSYGAAPRNPSQDFALMQSWALGGT